MSVVACPRCQEEVSLPPGIPKEAIVRCPLCRDEYALADAMISLPPLLEVVQLPVGYRAAEELAVAATHAGAATAGFSRNEFGRELPQEDVADDDFKMGGHERIGSHEAVATDDMAVEDDHAMHPTGPTVKRQLLHPPGSKKRKPAGSPIGTLIAIMLGGVLAIPFALFVLLWLPKEYHKDPFQVAPLLNQYAPYLLPEHLQKSAGMKSSADAKTGSTTKLKTPSEKKSEEKKSSSPAMDDEPGGLDFGNKFDKALGGDEPGTDPAASSPDPAEFGPGDPAQPAAGPAGDATIPEPKQPDNALPGGDVPGEVPAEVPASEPEMKKEPAPVEPAAEVPAAENASPDDFKPVADPPALVKVRQARQNFENRLQEYEIAIAGTDKDSAKAAIRAMFQSGCELAATLPPNAAGVADSFDALLSDPRKLGYTGLLSPAALDAETREHDGIITYGVVKSCRQADGKCELTIELPRTKRIVTVIGPEAAEGANVFVAGKITDQPALAIADYASADKKAIVAAILRETDK